MAKVETLIGKLKDKNSYTLSELVKFCSEDTYIVKQNLLKILHDELSSIPLDNNISKYRYIYKIFMYIVTPDTEKEKNKIISSLQEDKRICEKRIKDAQSSKKNKHKIDVIKKIKDDIELSLIELEYYDVKTSQDVISNNLLNYLIFDVKNYNYLSELLTLYPEKYCLKNEKGILIIDDLVNKYLNLIIDKNDNKMDIYYYEKVIKLILNISKNEISNKDLLKIMNKFNSCIGKINNLYISIEKKQEMLFFINEISECFINLDLSKDVLINDIYDTFNSISLKNKNINDINLLAYYFKDILKILDNNIYSIEIIHKLNSYMIAINNTNLTASIKLKVYMINERVIKYINSLNVENNIFEYLDYKYCIDDSYNIESIKKI